MQVMAVGCYLYMAGLQPGKVEDPKFAQTGREQNAYPLQCTGIYLTRQEIGVADAANLPFADVFLSFT